MLQTQASNIVSNGVIPTGPAPNQSAADNSEELEPTPPNRSGKNTIWSNLASGSFNEYPDIITFFFCIYFADRRR